MPLATFQVLSSQLWPRVTTWDSTGTHSHHCREVHGAALVSMVFQLEEYLKKKRILFIYFETEGKGKRKRGRETAMCVVAFHVPPTGDLASNPGMCPDWELNQ